MLFQKLFNIFNVSLEQNNSLIFALFVIFQLFNAVNARELGHVSIIKSLGKNKLFSCFDGMVFSGEIGIVKPNVEIFEYILRKYNLISKSHLF